MIELQGPTYKYNGEVLSEPEIIFINDHCYDEQDQCFHVKKLLDNSSCDPKLHTLIFDQIKAVFLIFQLTSLAYIENFC